MKTKILAGAVIATIATAGTLTYAASTSGTGNIFKNTFRGMHQTGSGTFGKGFPGKIMGEWMRKGMMQKGKWFGTIQNLTDAEKTQLESMSDTEKQTFFEAKMTEKKALHDARETVMDKLINGETLSDSEKATLETIQTERVTMKTERTKRETQMTEIKPIMEKVRAGTALTADEQAKIDSFKSTMQQGGKRGMGR